MADQLPTIQQQKLVTVRKLLESMKPQMMMVLGDSRHVETITRVAMTSIQRNPALLDCTTHSLMGAVMQSCQLGLEPDDVRGLAYLVPYKQRCTLVPGYGGILYLALQTEGVRDIYARLVHQEDIFEVDYGNETLIHKPNFTKPPGEVIGGYYMVVFENGYRRFGGGRDGGVMLREELDSIKAQALANKKDPNNPDLPWNRDWEQMCWKTLIRRSGKGLPKNSRLATAITLDEQAERGIPQNLEMLVDAEAVAAAEKKEPEPKAPRKSEAKKEQAPAAAETPKTAPPVSNVNGTLFGQGAPDDKITAATLEKIVAKMARWDKEHGSKVAIAAMMDTYKVAAVSALTEKQAQEWNEKLNESMGLPIGE